MRADRLHARITALEAMSLGELRHEWARLGYGQVPALPQDLLRRELAHRIQEKALGGLSSVLRRDLARVVAGDAPALPRGPDLRPGAQLIREWRGRTVCVLVEGDGTFRWEEQRYRSLSSIAKAVTGAHCSGPRFFGIAARG